MYVGSGESNKYDQILDSILVGPVVEGRHKFIFEVFFAFVACANTKLDNKNIVSLSVKLLLQCAMSYILLRVCYGFTWKLKDC